MVSDFYHDSWINRVSAHFALEKMLLNNSAINNGLGELKKSLATYDLGEFNVEEFMESWASKYPVDIL